MAKRISIPVTESTLAALNLRERLKQESIANAERDLKMAEEWFPLEEEAWEIRPGSSPLADARGSESASEP
jgi:hypothetical protein